MKDIPRYLEIYIGWIDLYIQKARKLNLLEEQIQTLVDIYRPPISEEDYMFMTYAHDGINDRLKEDIEMLLDRNKV